MTYDLDQITIDFEVLGGDLVDLSKYWLERFPDGAATFDLDRIIGELQEIQDYSAENRDAVQADIDAAAKDDE
jgi:hypothetical protein